jgi:hypothetical protein
MRRLLTRAGAAVGVTALVAAGLAGVATAPAAAAAPTYTLLNKASCVNGKAVNTAPKVRVALSFADKGPTAIGFDSIRDPDTWDYRLRAARNGSHTLTLPAVPSGYTEEFQVKLEHNPGTSRRSAYKSRTFTYKVPKCSGEPALFANSPAPRITGTLAVGRQLKAATAGWDPAPTRFSYRWQRSHAGNIKGATKATYTSTAADRGKRVRVIVTALRTGYAPMRMTSQWSALVKAGTFTTAPTPTVSGAPRAGQTLTASTGKWLPTPSKFTYQWYRGGNKVAGATSRSYKVTSKDKGRTIKVKVTAVRSGFLSKSMTSKSVTAR